MVRVDMPRTNMPSVFILNVIVLNVVILSVMAPRLQGSCKSKTSKFFSQSNFILKKISTNLTSQKNRFSLQHFNSESR
jgi:hypothetical protein